MATTTDNYELILPSGEDRVNPLTQVNPNFETIDAQMKTNANAGVGIANEIKTGTVHALTRTTNNGDCAVFRFLATSDFHLGDSFTVDGVSVTALLPSGEAIGDGAYVIGATILCVLVETRLTVYAKGGIASDSNALNGEPASFYLNAINETFNNTGTGLVATNTEAAVKEVNNKINNYIDKIFQVSMTAVTGSFGEILIVNSGSQPFSTNSYDLLNASCTTDNVILLPYSTSNQWAVTAKSLSTMGAYANQTITINVEMRRK